MISNKAGGSSACGVGWDWAEKRRVLVSNPGAYKTWKVS